MLKGIRQFIWRPRVRIGLVFFLIGLALIIVEARPAFPDPDSFYHAKMALLLRDQGFIHAFPWLQFTTLRDTFVNGHILYHALLIPFVTVFDPLVGMKVSAVIFGLIAFYAIFRFLQYLHAPCPELFTFAAFLCPAFFSRMAMPRAPALSAALLLLMTWLLIEKRRTAIFFCAFVFVWFYHGWPVTLLSFFAVVVAETIATHLQEHLPLLASVRRMVRNYASVGAYLCAGLAAGLVLNPYFPENIRYNLFTSVNVGVMNSGSSIPVGSEWYPVTLEAFLAGNTLVIALFALAVVLFFPAALKASSSLATARLRALLTCLFLASGYFVLTLKSVRFTEYAIPFFAATTGGLFFFIAPFLKSELVPSIRRLFPTRTLRYVFGSAALAAIGCFTALSIQAAVPNGFFSAENFAPAATYIRDNVPVGETVFQNNWDYSMIFFYLDDSHYFLVGLDTTFMYAYDAELFQLWRGLTAGSDGRLTKIVTDFHARTVVVDSRQNSSEAFLHHLDASPYFEGQPLASGVLRLYTCTELCDSL